MITELSAMLHFLPPRTVDGEGRDGDMLNLVFVANQDDLEDAFASAGWIKTDKTRFPAFWHLAVQRMHYAKMPMRRLFVFGRTQDYSYALPDSLPSSPSAITCASGKPTIRWMELQSGSVPQPTT